MRCGVAFSNLVVAWAGNGYRSLFLTAIATFLSEEIVSGKAALSMT